MKERLFAIGDIHGCIDQLRRLVESTAGIGESDQVVFLGDYIDRGEASREVIDYIIEMQDKGMDVVTLKGNHEAMLIAAYENGNRLYNWFLNGGSYTLDSFGITSVRDLPQKYIDFFYNLSNYYISGNYIFVHAGLNDNLTDPFEDTYEMIWTRRENYSNPVLKDKVIVHGHTPVTVDVCRRNIIERSRVINIDTGCIYAGMHGYGFLSAVEIYSMTLYSVEV